MIVSDPANARDVDPMLLEHYSNTGPTDIDPMMSLIWLSDRLLFSGTKCRPNDVLLLGQRRRRLPNIKHHWSTSIVAESGTRMRHEQAVSQN